MQSSDLSVSVPADDGDAGFFAVLSLAGRVTIEDCGWLHDLLEFQSAQAPGRLVVDLSQVSSMDWWVAVMLRWASRAAGRNGVTLELASPPPAVARLLDATAAAAEQGDCLPQPPDTDRTGTEPEGGRP